MQLKCLALKVCRYRVLLLHKDSRAHSSPAGYSRGKRERETSVQQYICRPVSNNIYAGINQLNVLICKGIADANTQSIIICVLINPLYVVHDLSEKR